MKKTGFEKNISLLNINGLRGRMLYLPAKKSSAHNFLLVYGHHASLERMSGIAENLNQYGPVTLPDLPGFGGMQSFYKIGAKPTLDNYADYLASFIKLKFHRKRLVILSMSFSFLIVTRMLQKYPELAKKVDFLISCVGFVHYEDFKLPKHVMLALNLYVTPLQYRLPAFLFRYLALQGPVIRTSYKLMAKKHSKMKTAETPEVLDQRIKAEINLWHINDVRTRATTMKLMGKVNLCDKKISLPVHHVSVHNDRYFDNHVVEQHMRIIFSDFTDHPSIMEAHMPSIVATAKDADPLFPQSLKKLLKT